MSMDSQKYTTISFQVPLDKLILTFEPDTYILFPGFQYIDLLIRRIGPQIPARPETAIRVFDS